MGDSTNPSDVVIGHEDQFLIHNFPPLWPIRTVYRFGETLRIIICDTGSRCARRSDSNSSVLICEVGYRLVLR